MNTTTTAQFEPHLKCITNLEPLGACLTHKVATLAIVGTASDWELRKHRNALVEYTDYAKFAGTDNLERVYYSIAGLLKLCDLIGSARAKAFKEAVLQQFGNAPGGALQVQPQIPYAVPQPQPSQLAYREPPQPQGYSIPGGELTVGNNHGMAIAFLEHTVQAAVHNALHAQGQTTLPQQPRAIENAIMHQQDLELKRLEAYTNSFLAVNGQTQNHELAMTDKRVPYVLKQDAPVDDARGQDKLIAILLMTAVIAIAGLSSYAIACVFKSPVPVQTYQSPAPRSY